MGMPGVVELLIIIPILSFVLVPFWMIFKKAGFPPWLSLGLIIPLVNLVLIFYLAFADWPALERT